MSIKFSVEKLNIFCYDTKKEMSEEGGKEAARLIRNAYEDKGYANLIFASSPSQLGMLSVLANEAVDWGKVNAFHMDEYIGLGIEHKASFANYIRENFFKKVKMNNNFYINGLAKDIEMECKRYADLLEQFPTDITFAGIGENGHLAFNDPKIADFFEPRLMKVNESLDEVCRQQQLNDGWFEKLEDIPEKALTITLSGLLRAKYFFATVPGKTKSNIIKRCLEEPISQKVPASILRLHQNAVLYIDSDSASKLEMVKYCSAN